MYELRKAARVEGQTLSPDELERINRQSLRTLGAEEVFVFKIAACGDQVDRDQERFTRRSLEQMAALFVGKTMLMDHQWSAVNQTGRIYAGAVEERDGAAALVLRAYMLRTDQAAPVIAAIEGGILREVSVGCRVQRALCSACGTDKLLKSCGHVPGREYGGVRCHVDLDGVEDAYEVSFTPVPAQPAAGVIKRYGGEAAEEPPAPGPAHPESNVDLRLRMLGCRIQMNETEE